MNIKFRNIESPIHSEKYRFISINHKASGRSFVIELEHVYYSSVHARISFKGVLCTRYTPLKLCESEYCERMGIFMQNNPEFSKMYSGIVEIVDCDELKDKSTFAKSEGFKHYLIITEDEYIEVLCRVDPLIEVLDCDEKEIG